MKVLKIPISSFFTTLFQIVLISASYFLLGKFGQLLAIDGINVSPIWPASGFALAVMLLQVQKAWLGIFIGSWLFNFTTFSDIQDSTTYFLSFSLSMSIAFGSTMQALVGYWILNRISLGKSIFEQTSVCSSFVLTVPLICLIGASTGVLSLWLENRLQTETIIEVWLTWWLGDSTGIMIAAPLILYWDRITPKNWRWSQVKHLLLIYGLLLISAVISFSSDVTKLKYTLPFFFLTWPLLMRLSLKHGYIATSFGIALTSFVAAYFTSKGLGPFIVESVNQSLLLLQVYIFVTAGTIYITTTLTQEKNNSLEVLNKTKQHLEQLNQELEDRVTSRTKELEIAIEIAENNARTDFLTGLYNLRAFNEYAQNMRAQSKRFKKPYSIAMIDIDNFKAINDKWGHKAGDKALQMIATSLNTLLR